MSDTSPSEERPKDAIPQDAAGQKEEELNRETFLQEMAPEDCERFAAIIILMSADTR
jgi:hypothetical protein